MSSGPFASAFPRQLLEGARELLGARAPARAEPRIGEATDRGPVLGDSESTRWHATSSQARSRSLAGAPPSSARTRDGVRSRHGHERCRKPPPNTVTNRRRLTLRRARGGKRAQRLDAVLRRQLDAMGGDPRSARGATASVRTARGLDAGRRGLRRTRARQRRDDAATRRVFHALASGPPARGGAPSASLAADSLEHALEQDQSPGSRPPRGALRDLPFTSDDRAFTDLWLTSRIALRVQPGCFQIAVARGKSVNHE